jgi:hypothetical protein
LTQKVEPKKLGPNIVVFKNEISKRDNFIFILNKKLFIIALHVTNKKEAQSPCYNC